MHLGQAAATFACVFRLSIPGQLSLLDGFLILGLETFEAFFEVVRDRDSLLLGQLELVGNRTLLQLVVLLVAAHLVADVAANEDEDNEKDDQEHQDPVLHAHTRILFEP